MPRQDGFENMQKDGLTIVTTNLSFGVGEVGRGFMPEPYELNDVGRELAEYMATFSAFNTAVCGDGRGVSELADGTDDPDVLARQVSPSLLGGLYYAAANAAIYAGIPLMNGVRSGHEAIDRVGTVLSGMGEINSAHRGCAALRVHEASTENPLSVDTMTATSEFMIGAQSDDAEGFEIIRRNKEKAVSAGVFRDFDAQGYEDSVSHDHPETFQHLDTSGGGPGGHGEGTILVIDGMQGFLKNRYVAETGRKSFSYTIAKALDIANKLGATPAERRLLVLAFNDYIANIANQVVDAGMPVVKISVPEEQYAQV